MTVNVTGRVTKLCHYHLKCFHYRQVGNIDDRNLKYPKILRSTVS